MQILSDEHSLSEFQSGALWDLPDRYFDVLSHIHIDMLFIKAPPLLW